MATSTLSLPWQCEQCGARFYSEILLHMHHDNFHSAKNKQDDKMIQRIRKIVSEDQRNDDGATKTQDRNYEECDSQKETGGAVKTERLMEDEGQSSDSEEMSLVVVNNDGTMYMVQDVGMEENEIITTEEVSNGENVEKMTTVEVSIEENFNNMTTVDDLIENGAEVVTENVDETVTEYNESFQTIPNTLHDSDKEADSSEREQSLRKIMFNVSNYKHSNVVQDRELPSFPCKRCDEVFSKHMLSHTQPAVRYECGVCGQQYALREHMRAHMCSHEQPRRSATLCNVCGQNYVLEGGRGGLRMRCPECDSKFRRHTSSSPRQLEDTRLSDSSERPYTCAAPGCLKSFRHPGHLRRHYASHVDDLNPSSYRQHLLGETPPGEYTPQ